MSNGLISWDLTANLTFLVPLCPFHLQYSELSSQALHPESDAVEEGSVCVVGGLAVEASFFLNSSSDS